MRRIIIASCLLIALTALLPSWTSATLRHISSGLLNVEADSLKAFASGPGGSTFVAVWRPAPARYALAKLDADGVVVWEHPVAMGYDTRIAMAATGDGGVVLVGGFRQTIDFGGGPMTSFTTAYDVFVARLRFDGSVQWQNRYGWEGPQSARDVAVDDNGDIVVTGTLAGVINFGDLQLHGRGVDGFLLKLSGAGTVQWAKALGTTGPQQGLAVCVDHRDRVAVSVRFQGGGLALGNRFYTNAGEGDVAWAVYDSDGNYLWSRYAGTPTWEEATDIAFDANDRLLVCGVMTDSLNLGGATLPDPGGADWGFLAAYDSLGAHRWSRAGTNTGACPSWLNTDESGNSWFLFGGSRDEMWRGLPASMTLVVSDPSGFGIASRVLGAMQAAAGRDVVTQRIQLLCKQQEPVDFGGGAVPANLPGQLSAAAYSLRPVHVAIDSLEAQAEGNTVVVTWNLESTEPLANYYLSRRIAGSGRVLLRTAPAVPGPMSFVDTRTRPGHMHTYRVVVATKAGEEIYSGDVSVSLSATPAAQNALEQNAPNPFNPLTTFAYSLAAPADVTVVIYDVRGAVVARLEQGLQPAGRHTASWGGHNMSGEIVASGVYYYRLEGVSGVGARKMLLLK